LGKRSKKSRADEERPFRMRRREGRRKKEEGEEVIINALSPTLIPLKLLRMEATTTFGKL